MQHKDIQHIIDSLGENVGLNKRIIIQENIQDVPLELLQLHMLKNAIGGIISQFHFEKKDYLEAFARYSKSNRRAKLINKKRTREFKSIYS